MAECDGAPIGFNRGWRQFPPWLWARPTSDHRRCRMRTVMSEVVQVRRYGSRANPFHEPAGRLAGRGATGIGALSNSGAAPWKGAADSRPT